MADEEPPQIVEGAGEEVKIDGEEPRPSQHLG